jgi:hypothetical protein
MAALLRLLLWLMMVAVEPSCELLLECVAAFHTTK